MIGLPISSMVEQVDILPLVDRKGRSKWVGRHRSILLMDIVIDHVRESAGSFRLAAATVSPLPSFISTILASMKRPLGIPLSSAAVFED